MDPAVWQQRDREEEVEDVGDEGFVEEDEDMDQTVFAEFERPGQQTMESSRPSRLCGLSDPSRPAPSATAPSAPSASSSGPLDLPDQSAASSDDTGECLGPDGFPGYQHVVRLAHCLVDLRSRLVLSDKDADRVIAALENLSDRDKQPIVMRERFRQEDRGRFKAKGKSSLAPGVLATKRCFLGSNQGPAQRVNSSRLLEAIIKELCELHPGDITRAGIRVSRWRFILSDFSRIRRLVLENLKVMTATSLQIPDINMATLREWHNCRVKTMERQVLEQGVPYTAPHMTTEAPLLPPNPPPQQAAFVARGGEPHLYKLPSSTAGMGKKKRSRPEPVPVPLMVTPSSPVPSSIVFVPLALQPQTPYACTVASATSCPVVLPSIVPRTTNWYRKRQLDKKEAGGQIRIYKRHKLASNCSLCQKERCSSSHTQYYGAWWCAASAAEGSLPSFADWLAQQKASREIKKKANPAPSAP